MAENINNTNANNQNSNFIVTKETLDEPTPRKTQAEKDWWLWQNACKSQDK